MGFPRLLPETQVELAPLLIKCIQDKPQPQQDWWEEQFCGEVFCILHFGKMKCQPAQKNAQCFLSKQNFIYQNSASFEHFQKTTVTKNIGYILACGLSIYCEYFKDDDRLCQPLSLPSVVYFIFDLRDLVLIFSDLSL